MATASYSNGVITLTAGDYIGSLSSVIGTGVLNNSDVLTIQGAGVNSTTWIDFQFDYATHGYPGALHIKDIKFLTTSIDDYAVYSHTTLTTMRNVTISGYSGDHSVNGPTDITSFSGASDNWSLTGGGAMRIRAADYSGVTNYNGSNLNDAENILYNVTVTNCCRGIRIQDCNSIYVKDCTVNNISDNGIYFATGDLRGDAGVENSTVDGCTVTNVGHHAFLNIGGKNNTFKNNTMDNSRGAAFAFWHINGVITFEKCTATNANTSETITPWNNPTDEFGGSACGVEVADDTYLDEGQQAAVIIKSCVFFSGNGSVFYLKGGTGYIGSLTSLSNVVHYAGFPDGILASGSASITTTGEIAGDPHIICLDGTEFDYTQHGYIRLLETTDLIINVKCEPGFYHQKKMEYFTNAFIKYKGKSATINMGWRGKPVSIKENDGLKLTHNDLTFEKGAKRYCNTCRGWSSNKPERCERHINKYNHVIPELIRNQIMFKADDLEVSFENVNGYNGQPCIIHFAGKINSKVAGLLAGAEWANLSELESLDDDRTLFSYFKNKSI